MVGEQSIPKAISNIEVSCHDKDIVNIDLSILKIL